MPRTALVSVRVDPSRRRVEITLGRGFTRADLEVVRALPGRRWDPETLVWTARGGEEVVAALVERLGRARVRVVGEADAASAPVGAHEAPQDDPGQVPCGASGPASSDAPDISPGTAATADADCAADASDALLGRIREALTVRGYSPRTRKVYLGHLRRFLE
jgi:hypothetical protein